MRYRRACITGASSGIGAALARALPRETSLLLSGRDGGRLQALAETLAAPGRRVDTLVADLSGEAGRERLIAAAGDPPIDLLVNNAGLGSFGRSLEIPAEAEREMLEVNVVAPVVLTRALLPGMLERARAERRRCGLIVVASTAAFAPLPYFATYAATKAFDLWYAEALAGELADEPVDVLAVCPGPTATRFAERSRGQAWRLPGAMPAEEVAAAALAALGRRSTVVVGARNRAYAAFTDLLPRAFGRPLIRAGMRGARRRLAR